MPRPCVPTIRSLSRGWTRMSSMRMIGMPELNGFHSCPASIETNNPFSVPTDSRSLLRGSSRTTLTVPHAGRLLTSEVHVASHTLRDATASVPIDCGRDDYNRESHFSYRSLVLLSQVR